MIMNFIVNYHFISVCIWLWFILYFRWFLPFCKVVDGILWLILLWLVILSIDNWIDESIKAGIRLKTWKYLTVYSLLVLDSSEVRIDDSTDGTWTQDVWSCLRVLKLHTTNLPDIQRYECLPSNNHLDFYYFDSIFQLGSLLSLVLRLLVMHGIMKTSTSVWKME